MDFNPIVLSIPIYFLLIGVELIIERFQKTSSYRINDAITNIGCGITDQIAHIFMKLFTITIYQLVYENFAQLNVERTWLTAVLLFVGADFCYYWAHRMSHQVNLFWGGHVVHHQSEDYNLSVALRQGAFQTVFTFFFYLPLAFIGFDTVFFVLINGLVTVYQFWIHTEHIGKLGWFEYIFNTPSHHRVHHGKDPKYIDRNHAGVFIIWDKMFGTFQVEEEKPTYGITVSIKSWNPVYAHFAPFKLMYDYMKIAKGLDKIRVLLKPPGWLPEYAGGFQAPPPVDKSTYQKFSTTLHKGLNVYVLFQFIITLSGASVFLFASEGWALPVKMLGAVIIIWAVVNFGVMFENRKWSFISEIIRLLATPFVILFFVRESEHFNVVAISLGIVYLISVIWLNRFRFWFLKNEE